MFVEITWRVRAAIHSRLTLSARVPGAPAAGLLAGRSVKARRAVAFVNRHRPGHAAANETAVGIAGRPHHLNEH